MANDPDLKPFADTVTPPIDNDKDQIGPIPEIFGLKIYYEWNSADKVWDKLAKYDPDPPADLPDGTYDGEIIDFDRVI